MGLLKSAPKVTIYSPRTLFVGRPYDVEVWLACDETLDIEYVEARIEGHQGWSVGSGKSRTSRNEVLPTLVTRLMDTGTLPAGETRLRARFTLPEGTAPSHSLGPAFASLQMKVHVAIPWWPDGRYTFTLPVRLPPPASVDRQPRAFRSTGHRDDPDDKRLELSLASTTLVAGETVTGSCALFHVDDRKERELEIAIVPRLELLGWRARERDADALTVTFKLPAGSAGTNIPFRFSLPEHITPTFETLSHRLRYVLVASSGGFFRGKVELAVPITIIDASAAEMLPELAPAPRLADERVAQLFDELARHGWQRARTQREGDVAVERVVGGSTARMTYTYRGEAGTFLVSTLEPPSLGLDLVVTPASPVRHVFFEDVEVDISDWDRHHHVAARSPAQAIPFLKLVVPALRDTRELGTMIRWTDDALVFERAVATLDETQLGVIGATLAHVAAAFGQAMLDIPPPPDVSVDAPAWRELAHRFDGVAGMGDLSIDGTVERLPASLGLEWRDGRPRGIRVWVGDPDAAGAELRAISLDLARPREEILSTKSVEPLVEQVVAWPADIVELRIRDGVASAIWLLPDGRLPVVDPTRVFQLAESLRSALHSLAPGAGPYR